MILRWIPWRFFATRLARAHGFLDPIQFLSKLRGFAQPSEVTEPVELLRAGVLFHARGLINTKAIQHNLDWVWPYWVERQFNPADESFIPRAFSFSHINLTHRNWTAVGLPDIPFFPIIDPRGLVTPLYDGWSLDFWVIAPNKQLFPSKLDQVEQTIEFADGLAVRTAGQQNGLGVQLSVSMRLINHHPQCVIQLGVESDVDADLVVALRPYNPEGISFIESIELTTQRTTWLVNGRDRVVFNRSPARCVLSTYKEGDVWHALRGGRDDTRVECPVSMASGAAFFPVTDLKERSMQIHVPITDELHRSAAPTYAAVPRWKEEVESFSRCQIPDARIQELYDIAVRGLILHSPGEVYPGPYTYKRFWYRDAAFILNAMITLGAVERSRRALNLFPEGQTRSGYFRSQDGEWDSNGEAIWIMHRFGQLTREALPARWVESIQKGAHWITKKRLTRDSTEPHAGLLPAGFSAEHLGPNDFYYWDNFWGVAGLRCAAELCRAGQPAAASEFAREAEEYLQTIVASFKRIPDRTARGAISASPHRRMDAGAIGSLVADFPLQLFPAGEERMLKTVEYLMEHSFFDGGFFQNMIHSGINAYLTLHIAQVLLRAGDARALPLIEAVARLATSTGQWPEAIHPRTKGGCMGDGQHIWAAAEWALMIRNLFVREEGQHLVIGSGVFKRWLRQEQLMSFGPTLTPHGAVTVTLRPDGRGNFNVSVDGKWYGPSPQLVVAVPGYAASPSSASENEIFIQALS